MSGELLYRQSGPDGSVPLGICAAVVIREYVVEQNEAEAAAEAMQATDRSRRPHGLERVAAVFASLREGGAAAEQEADQLWLDDDGEDVLDDYVAQPYEQPVERQYGPIDCSVCGGAAELSNGRIIAANCVVSGSCERSWVDQHPQQYRTPDGGLVAAALPCGGSRCVANLRLADEHGQLPAPELEGECAVDREGDRFRRDGRRLLDGMEVTSPDELEPYDGI